MITPTSHGKPLPTLLLNLNLKKWMGVKKVSEYDKEIPPSHTPDQPKTP